MIARREFLAAAGLGGLAACSGGSGLPVVGVVPKGTNHVFWQSVHAGAIKAGAEFDLEILWNAPQLEIDSARQIAIVENLITREVDGIVLAPVRRRRRWSPWSIGPPTAAYRSRYSIPRSTPTGSSLSSSPTTTRAG